MPVGFKKEWYIEDSVFQTSFRKKPIEFEMHQQHG